MIIIILQYYGKCYCKHVLYHKKNVNYLYKKVLFLLYFQIGIDETCNYKIFVNLFVIRLDIFFYIMPWKKKDDSSDIKKKKKDIIVPWIEIVKDTEKF